MHTLYYMYFKIFTHMNGKYGIFNHNAAYRLQSIYTIHIYYGTQSLPNVWPYQNVEYSQYWLNDKTGQVKFHWYFFATYKYKAKVTLCNYIVNHYLQCTLTHAYTHGYTISTLSKNVNIFFIHLTLSHCPFLLRKIFPL